MNLATKKLNKIRNHWFTNKMSLRSKLLLNILLPLTLIISIPLYFDLKNHINDTEEIINNKFKLNNYDIANNISREISEIESIAISIGNEFELDNNISSEEIYSLFETTITENDIIFGMALSFEPYQFDSSTKLFAPYVYRSSDSALGKLDIGESYDYTIDTNLWYSKPMEHMEAEWSEPFYDEGVSETWIVTYSFPIIKKDKAFALVNIDISFHKIKDIVNSCLKDEEYNLLLLNKDKIVFDLFNEDFVGKSVYNTYYQDIILHNNNNEFFVKSLADRNSGSIRLEKSELISSQIINYTPLNIKDWKLYTSGNFNKLYFGVYKNFFLNLISSIAIILLVFFIIVQVFNSINYPLNNILNKLKEYDIGNGILRIPSTGIIELNMLKVSLELMSSKFISYEKELLKRENRFRKIFENAGDAILITKDLHIVEYNQKFAELFGDIKKQIKNTGTHISNVFNPITEDGKKDETILNSLVNRFNEEGKIYKQLSLQTYDNSVKCVDINSTILEIDDFKGGLHIVHDITQNIRDRKAVEQLNEEIKKANETLEKKVHQRTLELQDAVKLVELKSDEINKQKQYLTSFIENTPTSILAKDIKGKYILANSNFLKNLNLEMEQVIGKTDQQITDNSSFTKYHQLDQQVLENKEPISFESSHKVGDDKFFTVSTKFPIFDNRKEIVGIGGIVTDITDRVKIENELRRKEQILISAKKEADKANEAKSRFLANMSHEIRTPLNAILGFTYILKKKLSNAENLEFLNKIKVSSSTLLKVINNILDFSKIEEGKLEIENHHFKLSQLKNKLEILFSQRALDKNIQLEINFDENIPENLLGDELRITQVLINLISNAFKFTDNGKVEVSALLESSQKKELKLHFYVKDEGIGLTKEQQARIFNPFSQADNSTTRKYGGTGLGLSISRNLVDLMGGEIGVISTAGEGSTFHFTIVLNSDDEIQNDLQNQAASYLNLKGKKAIVVEDNEMNQMLIKSLLEEEGIQVTIQDNGKKALDFLKTHGALQIDIILMDLQMPELDGFETTKAIQKTKYKNIPIIALTADALAGVKEECIHTGMVDMVTKPIIPENLFMAISETLENNTPSQYHNSFGSDKIPYPTTLDFNFGLKLLNNNTRLYSDLLSKFIANYSSFAEELRTEQLNKTIDFKTLQRKIHTLKGIAGNIGALNLQTYCLQWEDNSDQVKAMDYNTLNEHIQAVIINIETNWEFENEEKYQVHDISPALLLEIQQALINKSPEAKKLLKSSMGNTNSTFMKLNDLVDRYNYKEALMEISRLIKHQ